MTPLESTLAYASYGIHVFPYLIDNLFKPESYATTEAGRQLVEVAGEVQRFSRFTFNHVCNGIIYAQGEDPQDMWRLAVVDNHVYEQQAEITYPAVPQRGIR